MIRALLVAVFAVAACGGDGEAGGTGGSSGGSVSGSGGVVGGSGGTDAALGGTSGSGGSSGGASGSDGASGSGGVGATVGGGGSGGMGGTAAGGTGGAATGGTGGAASGGTGGAAGGTGGVASGGTGGATGGTGGVASGGTGGAAGGTGGSTTGGTGGTATGGAGGSCAVEVVAGGDHTCARKADNTLWCWGSNTQGQVGDGTTVKTKPSPVYVSTLGNSVGGVTAGQWHACARKGDGTLWCWGRGAYGQLGNGTTSPTTSPVQVTSLGTGVVDVAAGENHTCARKGDGTLWCWGDNWAGQVGDGTPPGLKASPVQVTALGTGVVEVATGGNHTCARKNDGTLWCWGFNGSAQYGNGTYTSQPSPIQITAFGTSVAEISAGYSHTCARKGDGTLWCAGANNDGQLGDGTASTKTSPVLVTALGTTVVEVDAGYSHTCARKGDGTVWCWGFNWTGAVGDGTWIGPRLSPIQVAALGTTAVEVSAGYGHTCARKADSTLWCWGLNSNGQVGEGTVKGSTCTGPDFCHLVPVKTLLCP